MNDREVLESTRALLSNHERWIKGADCRDKFDRVASFWSPTACKFSLCGALFRVGYITNSKVDGAHKLLKFAVEPRGYIQLAAFNDAAGTSHLAILDLLDKVIIKLGGKHLPRFDDEDSEEKK